ncbi:MULTISPECIES: PucR family transcriptional regulator [unclassified Paenibacillus]|uniref:PucR family transcriptional regulator n=1 Tax=unclassified Paenibacillus TaxID=185978 RepID=UPI002786F68D|nr:MULTISPECIES: PucR family transcriptional regulator [unclassified Paenibacillus]MDQ0898661.1 purine catabolism regulator [Paenibacillus sp. V4I7]MDQ0915347.1 purine catabolism regulator [Paenibacillus sp. V4I5]
MHLTIREALSIYPLTEAKLVAGKQGDSRIVKSVNVMDAPDIADWTKSGEMLFTTAFVMKDSPQETVNLLRKLNDRGAAGLGIKLGRFWSELPQIVADEADRLHFPIIEMPFQFTFSDQMNALFNAEYRRNTQLLQSVLEKQKKLMQFGLKQDNMLSMFQLISDILGYPMAVVGARGQILYNTSAWSPDQLSQNWPWKRKSGWVYAGKERAYRVGLHQQDDEPLGHLLIIPDAVLLANVEEGLFQQAADILTFHMCYTFRSHVEASAQRDLQNNLLRYLEKGTSLEEFLEQAEVRGLSIFTGAYQCVIGKNKPEKLVEEQPQGKFKNLKQYMESHPKSSSLAGHHFVFKDMMFSIYSTNQTDGFPEEELSQLLTKYAGDSGCIEEAGEMAFYTSSMKLKPTALREAYMECLETQRMASKLGLPDRVLHYETIEFAHLFQNVSSNMMEDYCAKILRPLLEKDAEYSQEMIRTLEVFIRNDGQVSEAAKQLFIHRNTVTYRLEKISDLLQVDFKKVNDLLKLKAVFLFRQFLHVR